MINFMRLEKKKINDKQKVEIYYSILSASFSLLIQNAVKSARKAGMIAQKKVLDIEEDKAAIN